MQSSNLQIRDNETIKARMRDPYSCMQVQIVFTPLTGPGP
jgi:hypothetical protein